MKNWIEYIKSKLDTELWGFIFIDYYSHNPKKNVSEFINLNLKKIIQKKIDPVKFHSIFLKVCIQLLIKDENDLKIKQTEVFEKSILLIKLYNAKNRKKVSNQQLDKIASHYAEYNKSEEFRKKLTDETIFKNDIVKENEKTLRKQIISKKESGDEKKQVNFHPQSLGSKRKLKRVKVLVLQPKTDVSDWEEKNNLFFPKDIKKFEKTILNALSNAKIIKADVVVFPELYVRENLVAKIVDWSNKNKDTIIISGSHYFHKNQKMIARCPVVFNGKIYYTEKIFPSNDEKEGLSEGTKILHFTNSPVGSFFVLICSDHLMLSEIRAQCLSKKYSPDIIIVIACQKDSNDHYVAMGDAITNGTLDLYCIYSNNKLDGFADGKSAFFGVTSKEVLARLKKNNRTDFSPKGKLYVVTDDEDYYIADIDLSNKRPPAKRKLGDEDNIQIFSTIRDYRLLRRNRN